MVMGVTKTEIFTEEQNQIASIAKALAHPARIAIIQNIFSKNTCVCGDLVDEIGLAQATISQHLRELKKVGISIAYSAVMFTMAWLAIFFASESLIFSLYCCISFLIFC